MTALVIREWDTPKEGDRLMKYYEPAEGYEDIAEKYNIEASMWTNGIGHLVQLEKFASLDDFAKAWDDDEYKVFWTRVARQCDNVTCRVLRPSISVPPE